MIEMADKDGNIRGALVSDSDIETMMRFYQVDDLKNLVIAQAGHIVRLQAQLRPIPDQFPRTPREG